MNILFVSMIIKKTIDDLRKGDFFSKLKIYDSADKEIERTKELLVYSILKWRRIN